MGWHQLNRQEELLTGGGRGVGDGRAEGLLAIGCGRQAAVSLMPDVYGTSSGSMLNQLHIHIFGSSHLEGSYVGDLLYRYSGSCLCRLILTFLSGHNTWTTALSNSMKLWTTMVESSDKACPLEKGMANHFSILGLRTPWTVWKGKKIGHWKMNSPGQ